MKSYEQRTENITNKAKGIVTRRKALISVVACMCCVAIVCGVLFPTMPAIDPSGSILNGGKPSDVHAYEKSDYFALIQKISDYKGKLEDGWGGGIAGGDADTDVPTEPGATPDVPDSSAPSEGDRYEESTLNQVAGVTEGDILKRSRNYAYYVTMEYERTSDSHPVYYYKISAYALLGTNTKLVGEFDVKAEEGVIFIYYVSKVELYLSEDAKTLTLVADCYNQNNIYYTCVVSLDVSQPSKIVEKSRAYVTGRYLSSRKVNGELLIVTNFYVPYNFDFDDPETFIPSCGTLDDRQYWQMGEIYCPEELSECAYTVVAKMNESDLEVTSKQAVLSYTYDVAVSTEHIFVIRNRSEYVQNGQSIDHLYKAEYGAVYYHQYAEIVCLEYRDGLKNVGSVKLEGAVNSRYWLDEKDGILRVVAQITRNEYKMDTDTAGYIRPTLMETICSASLYCVDLVEMKVVGSVENFAPNGETVQAVRYSGCDAYVCTAVVNTDPVFVFDLSDVNNITYKDTGTFPGYSINVLKFGDYLLGIGYGEVRTTLKIELYNETDSSVESVAIFEQENCNFSTEYKAHFIDFERQLVGLAIVDYSRPSNKGIYLLLQFDSETQTWRELLRQELSGGMQLARAFYADGLYLIGANTTLHYFSESALFSQNA